MEQKNMNVRNQQIEEALNNIAHVIGDKLPDDWGFTLMLFHYGENNPEEGEGMFYVSTASRDDTMAMMKEFIQRHTN